MLLKKHGLACWLNNMKSQKLSPLISPENHNYYGNRMTKFVQDRLTVQKFSLLTPVLISLIFFLFLTREYFGEKIGIYFAWLGRALLLFMKSFLLLLVPSFVII